jgi:hypothetical protein
MPTPSECPVCGGKVPPRARACPHCGADERSGWDEEAALYDGIDLPESAFEESEPSPRGRERTKPLSAKRPRGQLHPLWWIVAALLVLALLLGALAPRF